MFSGFEVPGFTPAPNEIFDNLMKVLSNPELRVLLAITRRVLGYDRDRGKPKCMTFKDISEYCNLSRSTTIRAVNSLEASGIIRKDDHHNSTGASAGNMYCLRYSGESVTRDTPGGGSASDTGGVAPATPHILIKEKQDINKNKTPLTPLLENETPPSVPNKSLDSDLNTEGGEIEEMFMARKIFPRRKSKFQTSSGSWTQEDRKVLRARLKYIPKFKMNGGQEKGVVAFLENEGVDLGRALTAVEGFHSSTCEHTPEMFRQRFYTWEDLGQRAAQEEPDPKKIANHVARPARALQRAETQQKPVFKPEQAIETWNQAVSSGKITDWDSNRDDYPKLKKLCLDPDFVEKLPSVCAKAEAIHKAASGWAPTFRWLIGKKGNVENWWKLHTGELDGMTKKRSSGGANKAQDEQRERVKKMLMQGVK